MTSVSPNGTISKKRTTHAFQADAMSSRSPADSIVDMAKDGLDELETASRSRSNSIPSIRTLTNKEPLNFGIVVPGVYRCSQPTVDDHDFVRQLGLKSVLSLISDDDLDLDFVKFMAANGIQHHVIGMRGTKKQAIPLATLQSILAVLLNPVNHPIMVHCSHGKHRTGCVVGVVRKASGWNVDAILDEYRSYAAPKARDCDIDYLAAFNTVDIRDMVAHANLAHHLHVSHPRPARSAYRPLVLSVLLIGVWFWTRSFLFC